MPKRNHTRVRLFVDDLSFPDDVGRSVVPAWMAPEYLLYHWQIVRSFPDFINHVLRQGVPAILSLDHDMAPFHYALDFSNPALYGDEKLFKNEYHKTGMHCLAWLLDYCAENDIPIPIIHLHTQNEAGKKNMKALVKSRTGR